MNQNLEDSEKSKCKTQEQELFDIIEKLNEINEDVFLKSDHFEEKSHNQSDFQSDFVLKKTKILKIDDNEDLSVKIVKKSESFDHNFDKSIVF